MKAAVLADLLRLADADRVWVLRIICATTHLSVSEVAFVLKESGCPYRITRYRVERLRAIVRDCIPAEKRFLLAMSFIAALPMVGFEK